MIVQKIKKIYPRPLDLAIKYYSVISVLNDLNLSRREIQLIAHTSVRGIISSITSKNEFVKLFDSSISSVDNMISKLYKKKLLVKIDGKIIVNPVISPKFNEGLIVQLTLESGG